MSWPNTVSLITGTVGDSLGSSGESADRIYVAVTPVFGEGVHRLLHAASGTVWDDRAVVTSGTPALFVQVPHVDQPGFVDGLGNEVTDWYYLVQVITRAGTGKSQWSYYWQPRVADGDTVDLDTLGDGVLVTDTVLVYTPGRDAADAREAAAQALASALEAEGLVTTAAGYVEAAAGSAQTAHVSEQNAATSVTDALAAVADAEAAESNAEDQAAAASTSAGQAASSATAAQTARTGAETARTGAETARTGAETALAGVPAAVTTTITDPTSAARTALNTTFAWRWKPNTAYTAGTVVQAPDGTFVAAKADFTSGSTYSSANWAGAFAPFRPVAFQIDAQVENMYMLGSYSAVNIVPRTDSIFATGITGWTAVTNCSVSWDPVIGHASAGSLKITHDGTAGTVSEVRSPIYTGITELLQYTVTLYSKPGTTQRNVTPTFEWRDGSGTPLSSTVAALTPERNGTWQQPKASAIAPVGAVQLSIFLSYANNAANEVHNVDEFEIKLAADRVYARNSANGNQLYYNENASFPGLDGFRPLPQLPTPCTIYKVAQALNGDLVAFCNQGGTNQIFHLTLGATAWTSVQAIQANVNALYRSMAVDPSTGRIYFAEYATSGLGVTTFNVWASSDNGNTWAIVETFVNFPGHIHAIKLDPFVPNRVWLCMGDSDAVANVRYTDNIDAGPGAIAWTVVDSGAQHARAVDLIFWVDPVTGIEYVAWAGDTPDTTQEKMYRWNSSTGVIDVISDDQELTGFYGAIDSAGRWLWATAARTDNDGYQQVRLWAGRINAYGRQAALSLPPVRGAVRLDCYISEPDSVGNIYVSYANQGVSLDTARLYRGHLVDANPSERLPEQMVDRQRIALPSFIKAGPYPGTDDAASTVAGRLWMQSFTPEVDMAAAGCWLHIGSALGTSNTIQVMVIQPDYKDFWKSILSISTADAPSLINTDQKFTFDTKVLLQKGKRYALGVAASAAGGKLRGGTAGIKNSNHARVIASGVVLPLTAASVIPDTKASIDVTITALFTSS